MIVLDFDGTIIDLWPRYWAVFSDILGIDIQLKDYVRNKRIYKKDSLVANQFGKKLPNDYFERKREMLEDLSYLSMDKMLVDLNCINKVLETDGCILTKRRNESNFRQQLNHLGIKGKAYVVDKMSKKAWIESSFNASDPIIIIGDSMEELEAAKLLNVRAIMVGYGICTKVDFREKNIPFLYLNNPTQLQEELIRRCKTHAIQRFTKTI